MHKIPTISYYFYSIVYQMNAAFVSTRDLF